LPEDRLPHHNESGWTDPHRAISGVWSIRARETRVVSTTFGIKLTHEIEDLSLTRREAINERDEVLKRMLKMKPKPHTSSKSAPKKTVRSRKKQPKD
jgi:hypothetical protein